MIKLIDYKEKKYPLWETQGNSAYFIIPYAKEVCRGFGYDIGCNKEEWSLLGSMPIDIQFNNGYHALKLPEQKVDYIFSNHCLEHLNNWVDALDYWIKCLNENGVIFLYLPHYSQEYWRTWNNRKHIHNLNKEVLMDYFNQKEKLNYLQISGCDLNHSFAVIAQFKK